MLKKILTIVILLLLNNSSIAIDTIVFDPKNLAEAEEHYRVLKSQFDQLVEHARMLETQIEQLDAQYAAITGKNDFHQLFEQKNTDGSNFFDWISTLDSLQESIQQGVTSPTDDISLKVYEYQEIYGKPHAPEAYVPHAPKSYSAQWQAEQALAVQEGLSVSEVAFDKADDINQYIKKLRDEAYEVSTQKEAIDYGNNIQLYMVTLMNEIMRLQAQQLRLLAVSENETTQVNDFNHNFFNTDFIK